MGATGLRLGGDEDDRTWQVSLGRCSRSPISTGVDLLKRPLVGLSIEPATVQDDDIDTAVEARKMETLIVWIVVIAALVALDAGALRWGVDSRDVLPDDHRR